MSPKALFVGIEAAVGKEEEVAEFLRSAHAIVDKEPDTRDWYALRFDARHFAIFDTFPGHAGRLKHLLGGVGRSLIVRTFTQLSGLPDIELSDILASKRPAVTDTPRLALHVPLVARSGQEEEVASFLTGALPLVEAEPGTLGWYAVRHGSHSFAIMDVFMDEAARQAHLSGQVAAALMARAGALFETPPQIHKAEVLATKISS
jgi:quinol monooxygenase YgiN